MSEIVAVVLAAGSGERLGRREPKAFVELSGTPILALAVGAVAVWSSVDSIVTVVPDGWEERARGIIEAGPSVTVVTGGATRQESVRAGLDSIGVDVSVVVCHDAARPFASAHLLASVLDGLAGVGGAVPVLPIDDTVKRVRDGLVVETTARAELGLAQTPQAFDVAALRDSHARAREAGLRFTDDAAILEWAGYRVRAVAGDPANFKITWPSDLARADLLVAGARP